MSSWPGGVVKVTCLFTLVGVSSSSQECIACNGSESVCLRSRPLWGVRHGCRADTEWDYSLTQGLAVLDQYARVFCLLVVGTRVADWTYQILEAPL